MCWLWDRGRGREEERGGEKERKLDMEPGGNASQCSSSGIAQSSIMPTEMIKCLIKIHLLDWVVCSGSREVDWTDTGCRAWLREWNGKMEVMGTHGDQENFIPDQERELETGSGLTTAPRRKTQMISEWCEERSWESSGSDLGPRTMAWI